MNPKELICVFYDSSGYSPLGSDGTYFSGLISMRWLWKRMNSKGFIRLKPRFESMAVLRRYEYDKYNWNPYQIPYYYREPIEEWQY